MFFGTQACSSSSLLRVARLLSWWLLGVKLLEHRVERGAEVAAQCEEHKRLSIVVLASRKRLLDQKIQGKHLPTPPFPS